MHKQIQLSSGFDANVSSSDASFATLLATLRTAMDNYDIATGGRRCTAPCKCCDAIDDFRKTLEEVSVNTK